MSDAGPTNSVGSTSSDWELVLAVRRGDADAFRILCERYRASLLGYFQARIGRGEVAEDLTQEVLVKVWRACRRNLPLVAFDCYLFRAAENRWKDYACSLQRSAPQSDLDDEVALADPSPAPDALFFLRCRAARIRRLVRQLPPDLRDVLVRSKIEGRKYQDIAAELGIPVGTVKWRVFEALRRLRQQLENEVS